jgi:hypothetical protein
MSGILEALGAGAALNAVAVTGSGLAAGAVSGAAASGLYSGSRLSICWLEEKRGLVKVLANKTVDWYGMRPSTKNSYGTSRTNYQTYREESTSDSNVPDP